MSKKPTTKTKQKTPPNPPVLATDKNYREVDVPCMTQTCAILKDVDFICIRKQTAVTMKK